MAKLTLTDLTNLQNETSVVAAINANNAAIETALENTLSRDGTSPNSMGADLDMNGNNLLNLPYPASGTEPVRLQDVDDLLPTIYAQASAPSTSAITGSLWIDSDSTDLDLYQISGGSWTDTGVNLKGAAGATGATGSAGSNGNNGTDGIDGDQIYVQASAPSTTGVPEGSIWIDSDSTQVDLYVLTGGSWVDSGVNLKGADGAGAGDVTAAVAFGTDNRLVRSDGTDKGVQSTGITVDDSNNVTGVVGLTATTVTSTTSNPTTIELGHASDTTLARVSAGVMSVEGETVHTNSTSRTATVSTLELGHDTDTTLSRSSAGVLAVEGVPVALNSTSATHTAGTVELGHASDTTLARSAAGVVTVEGTPLKKAGTEAFYIPATSMYARTTNGAASGTAEMTTNKNMFRTLDFDTTTQEFAQFNVRMPKSWNEGTITAAFTWSHASTTTNFGVVWAIEAVATSDDDAGDVAFGTAQQIADTGGTTNDIYISGTTPAMTVAGTPQSEDLVMFQVKRVPSDGSDTMAIDARLHGVTLYITTDAANDA